MQSRFSIISWFLWKQTRGKSNRFQDGRCHESKFQTDLKISVVIHPQLTKSDSPLAVNILTASYTNKLIDIHDRMNPTSLFPYLTSLESYRQIHVCQGQLSLPSFRDRHMSRGGGGGGEGTVGLSGGNSRTMV